MTKSYQVSAAPVDHSGVADQKPERDQKDPAEARVNRNAAMNVKVNQKVSAFHTYMGFSVQR